VLGAPWPLGVSNRSWPAQTPHRIASGRTGSPPASEHRLILGDFSLRTQGSPPTPESAPSLPLSNHFPTKSRRWHPRKCCTSHP